MNDREIKLFLEDGSEVIFKILFTFHHDERNADFVLVYDEKEPENVSGFSACNRYFGKFTYKKGKLIFKDMASTAMMCPNQTMELERRYLTQLEKVNNFIVDEDGQLLLRKDEKVLLIFAQ